jgi:hypothetical protein
MKNRSLLLVTALAFAGLSIAAAKSYDVTIDQATKAGSVQLAPGNYSMKVEGTNAIFTNQDGKQITTPVKVENADQKHAQTAVETINTNDSPKIKSIELGGSTETLEFGE